MLFPTASFAIFFLFILASYWYFVDNRFNQKLILLGSSYFIYALFDLRYMALLLLSIFLAYAFGRKIKRIHKKVERKRWSIFAVSTHVLFLAIFKYYDFFRSSLEDFLSVFGLESHLPAISIVLPLGISFYTFQHICYIVDIYKKESEPAKNLVDYMLYTSFFPQLLMGPIIRPKDFLHQIESPSPRYISELSRAITLITSGYLKKVFIASYLSSFIVEDAFLAPERYSSFELLMAAYAYTIQVFCDFSGYIDMGRGFALLLGFRIPDNFNNPYASTNIGEFWRRWHITFSSWLRDYIYFPLGGSRVSKWRTYINITVTFLLGGLWHGAHWKFVIWGALHGGALAFYKVSLDVRRAFGVNTDKNRRKSFWYIFSGWFLTFHFCVLARIFFNSVDTDSALLYFTNLWSFTGSKVGIHPMVFILVLTGLSLNFWGDNLQRVFIKFHERLNWLLRPLLWAAIAIIFIAIHPGSMAGFIYFQF